MNMQSSSKGMSILEIVIGSAIILILTTAIAGAWQTYLTVTRLSNERTQAALLIEEAAEALQFLRDTSWASNIATLTVDIPYYLTWNGSTYVMSTVAPVATSSFTRRIVLSTLRRDSQDNIIPSGGSEDPKSRMVTLSVFRSSNPSNPIVTTQMLIHDVYKN
jgi:Tfp pilus assembly protein PilE